MIFFVHTRSLKAFCTAAVVLESPGTRTHAFTSSLLLRGNTTFVNRHSKMTQTAGLVAVGAYRAFVFKNLVT